MNKNSWIIEVLSILNLACLAFCDISMLYTMTIPNPSPWLFVCNVFIIAATVFAFIYILKGYNKSAHFDYTRFFMAYAVAEFATVLFYAAQPKNVIISVGVAAAIMATVIVLGIGKDMGKKLSLTLAAVPLVLSAVLTVLAFVSDVWGADATTLGVVIGASQFTLGVSGIIMVFNKYVDKSARGSK